MYIRWKSVAGLLALLIAGIGLIPQGITMAAPSEAPPAAISEVARSKPFDRFGTHNVVTINYDTVNKRYRAHCISVGNSGISRQITACHLYRQYVIRNPYTLITEHLTGPGAGPGGGPYDKSTGMYSRTEDTCYYAKMGIVFPGKWDMQTLTTSTVNRCPS